MGLKKIYIILFICSLSMTVLSQTSGNVHLTESDKFEWLTQLTEKGLDLTKDSLRISEEFLRVLKDENYRASIFPKKYAWEDAIQLIQKQQLKQAFWFLINLYPQSDQNKELVVKSILAYDQLLKMDEILVNTFYTYCFIDPEVNEIKDGTPEIIHPDILESKLRNVKEIVGYIYSYRKQKEKEK